MDDGIPIAGSMAPYGDPAVRSLADLARNGLNGVLDSLLAALFQTGAPSMAAQAATSGSRGHKSGLGH